MAGLRQPPLLCIDTPQSSPFSPLLSLGHFAFASICRHFYAISFSLFAAAAIFSLVAHFPPLMAAAAARLFRRHRLPLRCRLCRDAASAPATRDIAAFAAIFMFSDYAVIIALIFAIFIS
jgi:hypothetical protein